MIFLFPTAPPRIEQSSLKERYKVMEGETLQITCQVNGSPTPTVQWYGYHTNPVTSEEERGTDLCFFLLIAQSCYIQVLTCILLFPTRFILWRV